MPDIPKIPCIQRMMEVMGEAMTESEARRLLDEAVERTKAYVESEKIPEWAAAERVATEMKREQEMLGAQKKRQVVMDAGARFQLTEVAKSGKKTWAQNLRTFLQKVEDTQNAIGSRDQAGFYADLAERKQLDGWHDRKNHLAIWQELEQLNYKKLGRENKVGFTGNEQALAVAEVFFNRRMERQATNNRWGAYTEEVPGYMFLQTHSSEKMRMAGMQPRFGIKAFGKESLAASFKAWRSHLDTLNIDWNRTVYGGDKEKFLKDFHNAVYNNIHGGPMEQGIEGKKYSRPGGSLADKLNSQRLLWFADAESSFKYNEAWGVADTPNTIVGTLRTGARNTAMLMHLGTRPVDNVELVRRQLLEDVFQERPEDSQKQSKELQGRTIQGQLDLLTGKANVSSKPWLTDAVDFVKNLTVAGKGGTIILTAGSDKAFMQSRMNFEGLSALERMAAQAESIFSINPKFAAEVGVFSHSLAGAATHRWDGEVKPVLGSHKLLQWVMKNQGMNWWTANNQGAMGMVVAHKLASDSHLPFEKLDARRQQILTEYGFSPKEWEVARKSVTEWSDGSKVVTPRSVQDLPDEIIGQLVDGPKTVAALDRARDSLATKLDYYIYDAVNEAVPTPTAAVRSIRTWNGTQRGEWSRELAELAFVFKGFPIKSAMTMTRQFQAPGGTMRALALVAQAGALGYLGGIAKDFLRGRTPKRLFDLNSDGSFKQINPTVWIDALARGGGLGIYGDLLLSDYDRRVRSALDIAAGPVLSELNNVASLFGKSRRVALGDEHIEGLGYESLRMVENNLPLIGMFPIKPVYDYFIAWQLKEALSPGVWRRTQKSVENHNHQEYFIEPVR